MQHSQRHHYFKVNIYMHQFDCIFMNKSSFIILQQLESFYVSALLWHNFYAIYGMCIKVQILWEGHRIFKKSPTFTKYFFKRWKRVAEKIGQSLLRLGFFLGFIAYNPRSFITASMKRFCRLNISLPLRERSLMTSHIRVGRGVQDNPKKGTL